MERDEPRLGGQHALGRPGFWPFWDGGTGQPDSLILVGCWFIQEMSQGDASGQCLCGEEIRLDGSGACRAGGQAVGLFGPELRRVFELRRALRAAKGVAATGRAVATAQLR